MSEPQMTKEQLAAEHMDWTQVVLNGGPPCFALMEDGRFCGRAQRWDGHSDQKVEFPYHKFVSLADILLAREGLRLREPPIDGDYLRQLHREFDCGCETCARTATVCPATASSLFQEVAILREHRDRLAAELNSLRKAQDEKLLWLWRHKENREVIQLLRNRDDDTSLSDAIDSAMQKEKSV